MALLSRPSAVEDYIVSCEWTPFRPGPVLTRMDETQTVLSSGGDRLRGVVTVGPIYHDDSDVLAWLLRWTDGDDYTPLPLDGVATSTQTGSTVSSTSGAVITTAAAHSYAVGDGVRIDDRLGIVVAETSTTLTVVPSRMPDGLSAADTITSTDEVLALAIQPADLPVIGDGGLLRSIRIPWVEK